MTYDIPGMGILELKTVIIDLNGTLAVNGVIVQGVIERLEKLKKHGYSLILLTGNTRGDADSIAKKLGIVWFQAKTAADKRAAAVQLGAETCVSIGNGRIDLELTEIVGLGIVVLQSEGVHVKTLLAADLVVPTICDALDMLLDPQTLIATLRR